ncbi:YHS domain-containing (seleno)protein [Mesorhizobium sp. LHD-90]|uniref:YHS domain-containing (seleno)protein n=1 Tax=Mesorhizobium sp. LHD-90 TaxID=3071414 RepID=UPI0027DF8DA5|nr:YHS domain-containing (seleno)protein [Mesorhizobium sp. LHD-90]MDQ6433981.1 YHS domain-containing (seleno)protein [Mesorhizobium sp. LHD-90]
MFISKRNFFFLAAMTYLSLGLDWQAHGGNRQAGDVSTDRENVAIGGYDTVAYFTDGKPTQGSSDHEFVWNGARWWFASGAHRDMFASQPESYAPRFGGYCVMAMIDGARFRPDPEAWAIVDGRLYLSGDREGIIAFQQDTSGNIRQADERWEALHK